MKKEYTQRTARLIGQDKVDELDTKKVLIFGVGGVGSAVVEALGRAGVGHLILVDADVFDPSNVNVFQFTPPCGGRLPADGAEVFQFFISIHAPVWGATANLYKNKLLQICKMT